VFYRAITTAVALLVLLQAALAGSFLSGQYEALAAHARNGGITVAGLLLQSIAALVLWRSGAAPGWPVRAGVIQLLIAGALIPLGQQRILTVHVPLAVLLTVGVAVTTYWAWRTPPGDAHDQPAVPDRRTVPVTVPDGENR
jgi:hypothetical protein